VNPTDIRLDEIRAGEFTVTATHMPTGTASAPFTHKSRLRARSAALQDLRSKLQGNVMFKIKPLQDRVIIERIAVEEKIGVFYVPESAQQKANEGFVVAVGEGRELKSGVVKALSLNVGDRVMFEAFGGTDIKVDGKEYVMLREESVMGVVVPEVTVAS
jgi:chaperonin GroES